MNKKQVLASIGYVVTAIITALSDKITVDTTWADIFAPNSLFKALAAGVIAFMAYKSNGFQEKADKPQEPTQEPTEGNLN
jgi:hypothetical protein